jgi:hypothetical protein
MGLPKSIVSSPNWQLVTLRKLPQHVVAPPLSVLNSPLGDWALRPLVAMGTEVLAMELLTT